MPEKKSFYKIASQEYRRIKWQMVTLLKNNDTVIQQYELSMFRRLRELYHQYKPYVRVDLIMYGVLILFIFLYFLFTVLFE
ncbi:MAG: hypothetical protein WKF87_20145 [Chryseolinea sp.]